MKRFFIFMLICNLLSIFSNSFGMNPDAQPRENTKDVLEEITGYNKINDSLKAQIVKNRIKNANPDNLSKIIKLTAAAMHDINAPAFFAIFNDPSCVEKIGNWCDKHDNNFLHLSICYVKDRFIDKTIKMIVDIYPNFINHCNNQKRTPLVVYLHQQIKRRKNDERSNINLKEECEIVKNVPETLEDSTLKILANYTFNKIDYSYLEKMWNFLSDGEKAILQEKIL